MSDYNFEELLLGDEFNIDDVPIDDFEGYNNETVALQYIPPSNSFNALYADLTKENDNAALQYNPPSNSSNINDNLVAFKDVINANQVNKVLIKDLYYKKPHSIGGLIQPIYNEKENKNIPLSPLNWDEDLSDLNSCSSLSSEKKGKNIKAAH
ncbi:hypothetical protein Mgra_00009948 [Meloidogyne graminicola]|uniref:Uncharacterized protein n=1 Tax=Meloidogyne graminicola TaxID=189291 RepID=A0A8S9ZB60_9BILA|nr:hypothetical protein Mgra_00009948 [Meloidogyne graminicola]